MSKLKLIIIYVLIIGGVVGLAFWLFTSSEKKATNKPGQEFAYQGQEHITQGSTEHAPYNSNPPTSGPHWPQPAEWGVYDTTLTDEQLVHNLEHGGIWVSYKPDKVDAEMIAKLKDFANRYPLIIVEPRANNDAPIVLAAWQHLENLDSYDERTILDFINAYHNKGPEKVM